MSVSVFKQDMYNKNKEKYILYYIMQSSSIMKRIYNKKGYIISAGMTYGAQCLIVESLGSSLKDDKKKE